MRPHAALVVGAIVLLGGCLGATGMDDLLASGGGADLPETTTVEHGNVTGTFVTEDRENVTVTLEVANTSEERREGLMHRQSLPDDHGMVFVYADASPRSFWMKNTYVPLDIIFIAPSGTVLNVEHARPQPNASDADLERYRSDGDAKYVVELERGFANETGVTAGTQFAFNDSAPEAETDLSG